MRRILTISLLCISTSLWAQQGPRLDPLPEPPPLPPGVVSEGLGEAPIRILPGQNDQIEEIVVGGKREIRVTTPSGLEYRMKEDDLVAPRGGPTGAPLSVPLWVIQSF